MFGEENLQTAGSHQALAQAYFRTQDFRKALQSQEFAYKTFKDILPENTPYIQQAKQQLDYYFRLSVSLEKQKKQQSAIKAGKVSTTDQQQLIAAIQAAQKRNAELLNKETAEEGKSTEAAVQMTKEQIDAARLEQQRIYEANAFQQRYSRLVQRINNPKQRNQLDILEFQAIRERQYEAQRLAHEQLLKQARAQED